MNRRRAAAAKSHHASRQDLREARQRLKEVDAELRQIALLPETKQGEEREQRYERVLKLRAMRDEFQSEYPVSEAARPNSLLLAFIMTVGSFMLCAFCAASGFAGLSLLNQKPDPVSTANGFWSAMQSTQYDTIDSVYFSSTLRAEQPLAIFIANAQQADEQFGKVTSAVLTKQAGDLKLNATLTYSVTRAGKIHYTVILVMAQRFNAWGITDLGAAISPTEAGVPAPAPTVTPSPSATGTTTPGQ